MTDTLEISKIGEIEYRIAEIENGLQEHLPIQHKIEWWARIGSFFWIARPSHETNHAEWLIAQVKRLHAENIRLRLALTNAMDSAEGVDIETYRKWGQLVAHEEKAICGK